MEQPKRQWSESVEKRYVEILENDEVKGRRFGPEVR